MSGIGMSDKAEAVVDEIHFLRILRMPAATGSGVDVQGVEYAFAEKEGPLIGIQLNRE